MICYLRVGRTLMLGGDVLFLANRICFLRIKFDFIYISKPFYSGDFTVHYCRHPYHLSCQNIVYLTDTSFQLFDK